MPSLVGDHGPVLQVLGWTLTRMRNISLVLLCMCNHFGAVKVVQSKSSDKHESNQTLRGALKKKLVQTGLRYIGG